MKSIKRLISLICIYIISIYSLQAAHILGGGFQYEYLGDNQFKLKLKIFRDPNSGGANFENIIQINMRQISNDSIVKSISLPRIKIERKFIGSICQGTSDIIDIGYYEDTVQLDSNMNSVTGYYFTWERCCRQNEILNIVDPGSVPTTFYLSLPKLYFDSEYLNNKTPEINFDFKTNVTINDTIILKFQTIDKNEDNVLLVLATPIAGSETSVFNPAPRSPSLPIEYSLWSPNHSLLNPILNEYYDMNTSTGDLSIDALNTGLNAIAFELHEYRNGNIISKSNVEYTISFKNILNYFKEQPKNITNINNDTARFYVRHSTNSPIYQWQVKSIVDSTFQNIINATNNVLQFEFNSNDINNLYRCIVNSNTMLCGDTSNVVGFSLTTSVNKTPHHLFNIYPNPVNSKIFFDTNLKAQKIEVYDLRGKEYLINWNSNTIDVSILDAGIYILKILDQRNQSYYNKFIKID